MFAESSLPCVASLGITRPATLFGYSWDRQAITITLNNELYTACLFGNQGSSSSQASQLKNCGLQFFSLSIGNIAFLELLLEYYHPIP